MSPTPAFIGGIPGCIAYSRPAHGETRVKMAIRDAEDASWRHMPRRSLVRLLPALAVFPLLPAGSSELCEIGAGLGDGEEGFIDVGMCEPEITHRVYFDVSIDKGAARRTEIGLYGDVAPVTVGNFLRLVESGYAGTFVYRIVPGLTIQLGDVLGNGGRSGRAAVGENGVFEMENFKVKHSVRGLVSMARGVGGSADSRWFVEMREGGSGYLDGKYCAFGRVVSGMEVWEAVERVGGDAGLVRVSGGGRRVRIAGCGLLQGADVDVKIGSAGI